MVSYYCKNKKVGEVDMKKRQVIIYIVVMIILLTTSVYATISTELRFKIATNNNVIAPGD